MLLKQNRIETIDTMRVIAMLAVIQIHSPWHGATDAVSLNSATILNYLMRFAVPFFFVISGYLWSARCASTDQYWPRSVAITKRALLIFCFWSLIYAAAESVRLGQEGGMRSVVARMVSVVHPFHPLGFVNSVLEGTKTHLWFLPSLAMAASISGALLARRRERTLFVLAIVLFALGLAGSAYSQTPYGFTVNFNFWNGPFLSLIMFVSGYAIYRYGQGIALLPVGIGLTMGGFALQLVESIWIHQKWGAPFAHDYVAGTYFFGVGMSMIALSNAPLLRIKSLASIGPLILGVYASHFFFVERIHQLEGVVDEPYFREVVWIAIVFSLALATSFVLARWRPTKQFVT